MKNVYVAKPNLNNERGQMEFDNIKAAVNYLSSFMPHDYPNLKADDWHFIGKLYEKSGATDWLNIEKK